MFHVISFSWFLTDHISPNVNTVWSTARIGLYLALKKYFLDVRKIVALTILLTNIGEMKNLCKYQLEIVNLLVNLDVPIYLLIVTLNDIILLANLARCF